MRLVFLVLALLAAAPALAPAQSSGASTSEAQTARPYTDDEFEPWVRDLRRAEILAVGTFPLAYLLAGLGYDYYYYLSHGFPQDNIPWPVGPGTSQWVAANQPKEVQQKNLTLIGVSLAAGVLLAAVDWWLGQ